MSLSDYVTSVEKIIDKKLKNVHTALPAEIVSVDYETGLASVKPIMKFVKPNGEKIDYPKISNVPIVFPQGNSMDCTIVYPVKEGDTCLLIISEQSLDEFMFQKATNTNLRHDISNSICIPGLFRSLNTWLQTANDENAIIMSVGAAPPVDNIETSSSSDEDITGSYIKITSEEIYMNSKKIHLDAPEVVGVMQNTVTVDDGAEDENTGSSLGSLLSGALSWFNKATNTKPVSSSSNSGSSSGTTKKNTKKSWWKVW